MASNQNFVDFVMDQIQGAGEISVRKMFGEYAIYSDGKIFGLICDNQLFIKPTTAGKKFIGEPLEAPPYPGAKNSYLILDLLENSQWLSELIRISLPELPMQKTKSKNSENKKHY